MRVVALPEPVIAVDGTVSASLARPVTTEIDTDWPERSFFGGLTRRKVTPYSTTLLDTVEVESIDEILAVAVTSGQRVEGHGGRLADLQVGGVGLGEERPGVQVVEILDGDEAARRAARVRRRRAARGRAGGAGGRRRGGRARRGAAARGRAADGAVRARPRCPRSGPAGSCRRASRRRCSRRRWPRPAWPCDWIREMSSEAVVVERLRQALLVVAAASARPTAGPGGRPRRSASRSPGPS